MADLGTTASRCIRRNTTGFQQPQYYVRYVNFLYKKRSCVQKLDPFDNPICSVVWAWTLYFQDGSLRLGRIPTITGWVTATSIKLAYVAADGVSGAIGDATRLNVDAPLSAQPDQLQTPAQPYIVFTFTMSSTIPKTQVRAEISRSDSVTLGPLTTAFAQPSHCADVYVSFITFDSLWTLVRDQSCTDSGPVRDTACFPPDGKFYAPGVACPINYVQATSSKWSGGSLQLCCPT